MKSIDIEDHYIVASEHVETIETYLEKQERITAVLYEVWGLESGGDLAIAFEQIGDASDAIVMNGDIIASSMKKVNPSYCDPSSV